MSEVRLPAIELKIYQDMSGIEFSFKVKDHNYAKAILDKRTGAQNQVMIKISKPHRPRTTGPRSQSAHFHGHVKDIATQSAGKYSPAQVKQIMKGLSMMEGFPSITGKFKNRRFRIPISEADASTIDEKLLIDITHQFADENNFWLIEYDKNDKSYKTIGGRSRSEMETYLLQYPEALK
jgi:hypothetical protein